MRRSLRTLRRDSHGAALVEFAIAVPVLIAMLIGIAQLGLIFYAHAGLRQSVEEGARLATIFPRPTKQEVIDRINAKKFGLTSGTVSAPQVVDCTDGTYACWDISMSYTTQLQFAFISTPPVTLTASRRVFLNPVS